jgi:hypothetical protein
MPINSDPVAARKRSMLFSATEVRTMLDEFRELVREGRLHVTVDNQIQSVRPTGDSDVQERSSNNEPLVDAE